MVSDFCLHLMIILSRFTIFYKLYWSHIYDFLIFTVMCSMGIHSSFISINEDME